VTTLNCLVRVYH
jgi:hypothetical protein